jgi:hypothetical protein
MRRSTVRIRSPAPAFFDERACPDFRKRDGTDYGVWSEAEWTSIVESDSLGTLSRVAYPMLIVRALRPLDRK